MRTIKIALIGSSGTGKVTRFTRFCWFVDLFLYRPVFVDKFVMLGTIDFNLDSEMHFSLYLGSSQPAIARLSGQILLPKPFIYRKTHHPEQVRILFVISILVKLE